MYANLIPTKKAVANYLHFHGILGPQKSRRTFHSFVEEEATRKYFFLDTDFEFVADAECAIAVSQQEKFNLGVRTTCT